METALKVPDPSCQSVEEAEKEALALVYHESNKLIL